MGLPGREDQHVVRDGCHRGMALREWGFNPGTYSELRPGCFDVHERVRDMNANGVLGSMCFPTMAGWNARTFAESRDKEVALVMLQAYNDWAIDEWCGAYPGRFIPLGIVPMWDVEEAAKEVLVFSPWNSQRSTPSSCTTFGASSAHFWGTWFSNMSGGSM